MAEQSTLRDIIAELEKQVAWRGPQGRALGHIAIERDKMEVLLNWVKEQIAIKDANPNFPCA